MRQGRGTRRWSQSARPRRPGEHGSGRLVLFLRRRCDMLCGWCNDGLVTLKLRYDGAEYWVCDDCYIDLTLAPTVKSYGIVQRLSYLGNMD